MHTPQPHYNIVCYNMVMDITKFQDGFQKIIDYIEKCPEMVIFYIIYTFFFGYNAVV